LGVADRESSFAARNIVATNCHKELRHERSTYSVAGMALAGFFGRIDRGSEPSPVAIRK